MSDVNLSRSELLTLIFDKLELIGSEVEQIDGERKISEIRARVAHIASEARRIQKLIEHYESVERAGTCVHCGRSFAEHDESAPVGPLPPQATVRPKGAAEPPPRCRYLRGLFESLELATYQPLLPARGDGS